MDNIKSLTTENASDSETAESDSPEVKKSKRKNEKVMEAKLVKMFTKDAFINTTEAESP